MTHDDDAPHTPDPSADPEAAAEGDSGGEDNFDDVNKGVKGGTKAAGEAVKAISEGIKGKGLKSSGAAAGAAAGVLDIIAGELDEDEKEARKVLKAVSTGLGVAKTALGAIDGLSDALGGGGEAARGLPGGGGLPNAEQYSNIGGSDVGGALADMLGGSGNVSYHLEVDGVDAQWTVRTVQIDDGIGGLPSCFISASCARDTFAEETELFDKDACLTIERGEQQRLFKGMVSTAHLGHGRDFQTVEISIVPALWLLSQTQDSRVFQDKTVPEVVEELFSEYLGSRQRTVRSELTESYASHEYLVQYAESHFQFIHRLCDEEGIFFFFDHEEGDHEILVLADSNANRPNVDNGSDGRIDYTERQNGDSNQDAAFNFHRSRTLGATDAVVSGYDWTNPPLTVRHEVTGRGESRGPALETHEHHHALRHHEYDEGGGSYQSNTVQRVARMSTERHDLERATWSVSTTVIGVAPGHIFELVGSDEHDGRYLILNVTATGSAASSAGGFSARLRVVPADTPYRPARPERPLVLGPETATVVGAPGEEIDCDQHGRVKVQFHWDRRGQRDHNSSVWIRVMQTWAGSGFGAMFIPRIGMEVIVSFLGGDPERPIITGCVYNGSHPVPYALPEHKTRSTLKTHSSPNSEGFNELRFEDKAGSEEVYIHAEKDFNEEVKNCHSTHVGVDQSNTVDRDQTELVKRHQTLTVDENRTKHVKGNEWTVVGETDNGFRNEFVYGDEDVHIDHNRAHVVRLNDSLNVADGDKFTIVEKGKWDIATMGEFKVVQNGDNELYLQDAFYLHTIGRVQIKSGDGVRYVAEPGGRLQIKNTDKLHVQSDSDQMIESTGGLINLKAARQIVLDADVSIVLHCGASSIKLSPSGIMIEGPTVKINATSGATEIDAASQVKIKC